MIDRDLLDKKEPPIPDIALALNQMTSSQTMRAILVVMSSGTMIILVWLGRDIPDPVTAILFSVLGYYFGEAAPIPNGK